MHGPHHVAHFTNASSITVQISWKYYFALIQILINWSLHNLCTCHGSCAAVACAKFCSNQIVINWNYSKTYCPLNLNFECTNLGETIPWSVAAILLATGHLAAQQQLPIRINWQHLIKSSSLVTLPPAIWPIRATHTSLWYPHLMSQSEEVNSVCAGLFWRNIEMYLKFLSFSPTRW